MTDERGSNVNRRRVLRAVAAGGLLGAGPSSVGADETGPIPGGGGTRGVSDPRDLPTWRVRHEDERVATVPGPYLMNVDRYVSRFAVRGVSQVNLGLLEPDDVAVEECGGDGGQIQHRFIAATLASTVERPYDAFNDPVDPSDAAVVGYQEEAPDVVETLVDLPEDEEDDSLNVRPTPDCGNVTFRVNRMHQVPIRIGDVRDAGLEFETSARRRRIDRDVEAFYGDSGRSISNALPSEGDLLEEYVGIPSEAYDAADWVSDVGDLPGPPGYDDVPYGVGRLAGKVTTTLDVIGFLEQLNGLLKDQYIRDFELTNDAVYLGQNNVAGVADSSLAVVDFTVTLPPGESATMHVYQNATWSEVSEGFGDPGAFAGGDVCFPNRLDWLIHIPSLDLDADLDTLGADRLPRAELVADTATHSYNNPDAKGLKPQHLGSGLSPEETLAPPALEISAHEDGESPVATEPLPQFSEGTSLDVEARGVDSTGACYNWRVYKQGGLVRPYSVGEDDGRILLSNLYTSDFDAISAVPEGPARRSQLARERARSYRSPFGPGVYTAEVTVTDAYGRRAEAATRFQLLREDVDEGPPVARISVEGGAPSPQAGVAARTAVGSELTFDASGSTSRDDGIDLYDWHVQVPETYAERANTPVQVRSGEDRSSIRHRFAFPGRYLVRLYVYEQVDGFEPTPARQIRERATGPPESIQNGNFILARTDVVVRVEGDTSGGAGGGPGGGDSPEPIAPASIGTLESGFT